jgi:hypothetical protein
MPTGQVWTLHGKMSSGSRIASCRALFTLLVLYFVVFLPWRWAQGQKQVLNGPVRAVEAKQEATSIAVPDRKGNSSHQSLLLPVHNSVDRQRSVELSNYCDSNVITDVLKKVLFLLRPSRAAEKGSCSATNHIS